jgi:hypothetical protein
VHVIPSRPPRAADLVAIYARKYAARHGAAIGAGCCEWVPLHVARPPVGEFVALVQAGALDIELAELMPDGAIETMTGAPAVAWLRGLAIPQGVAL